MGAPSSPLHRAPSERLHAWLVTGPLGHLWSVVIDLGVFLARRVRFKAKTRS